MNEVKAYRITGRIVKPNFKTKFVREIVAMKQKDALEHIYTNIGSKHRAKRHQIIIDNIEEEQNKAENALDHQE
jgi:large subunit ribosomal protein LX